MLQAQEREGASAAIREHLSALSLGHCKEGHETQKQGSVRNVNASGTREVTVSTRACLSALSLGHCKNVDTNQCSGCQLRSTLTP